MNADQRQKWIKKWVEQSDRIIYIKRSRFLREEIGDLIAVLEDLKNSCIDATFPEPPTVTPLNSYFDSIKDETVMTVEITDKILSDFQKMQGTEGGDIRKTIVSLIDFYNNNDNLNLILTADVLTTRQSYVTYTHQLAQYLRTHQRNYRHLRVEFDPTETRLGVFCRKDPQASPLSKSLVQSIVAMLRVHRSAQVNLSDIPISYLKNRAALKHLIKYELGETPRLEWGEDCLKIFYPTLK